MTTDTTHSRPKSEIETEQTRSIAPQKLYRQIEDLFRYYLRRYVSEAEHEDGYKFWEDNFTTVSDVLLDATRYIQSCIGLEITRIVPQTLSRDDIRTIEVALCARSNMLAPNADIPEIAQDIKEITDTLRHLREYATSD